jgi:hypothetical protein
MPLFPPALAPAPSPVAYFAANAFADGALNPPGPGVDPNSQSISNLTQTMDNFMAQLDARQNTLKAELRRSTAPPVPFTTSLPGPTRPIPQHAPHFVPFLATPEGEAHLTYSAPLSAAYFPPPVVYQAPTGGPPFSNVGPQAAYQQPLGPHSGPYPPSIPPTYNSAVPGGHTCSPRRGCFS